jgi:hypothetical protein
MGQKNGAYRPYSTGNGHEVLSVQNAVRNPIAHSKVEHYINAIDVTIKHP